MNGKEIKRTLVALFSVKQIFVNTGTGSNPYIEARYKFQNDERHNGYLNEFPVEFRRCALEAIYGDKFAIGPTAEAGNVRAGSIAMQAKEWENAIALFISRHCQSTGVPPVLSDSLVTVSPAVSDSLLTVANPQ